MHPSDSKVLRCGSTTARTRESKGTPPKTEEPKSADKAGTEAAKAAEHNYKHTSIIHSHDVEHMTAMARALDTTLFVKNGPCMAGLGLGGEGYLSYSIATPTGEGVTNPKTFCRVRRCVMVDNLRIY